MTRKQTYKIIDQQAQRVAAYWSMGENLVSNDDKIAMLREVAAETMEGPFAQSVLTSRVIEIVGIEAYRKVFPLPVYR